MAKPNKINLRAFQQELSERLKHKTAAQVDSLRLALECGDCFVLSTDGVYEHVDMAFVSATIAAAADLDAAARTIVDEALRRGSPDNLTIQLVDIVGLPDPQAGELQRQLAELPLAPALAPRMRLDGYTIVRALHASARA